MKRERHDAIMRIFRKRWSVSVKDIARALKISEMTVRRDLAELASAGEVVRVHGGARLPSMTQGTRLARVRTHSEKQRHRIDQKRHAARLAAGIVSPGETIFLGGGTTMECMAEFLPRSGIRVVTDSMPIFSALAGNARIELYLTGGTYRSSTRVLVGLTGERGSQTLLADKAFVGATGIFDNDVFGSTIDVGALLADALDRAAERYLVVDSSKIGRRDYFAFCPLDHIDAVFSDGELASGQRDALRRRTKVFTEARDRDGGGGC